jgi:hypothetical protein
MNGWCAGGYQKTANYQLMDSCKEQRSLEEDFEGGLDPTWVVEPDMM